MNKWAPTAAVDIVSNSIRPISATHSVYLLAGFEARVEDGLSLVVDEEWVNRAPQVFGQEVLYHIQRRIDPHNTNVPASARAHWFEGWVAKSYVIPAYHTIPFKQMQVPALS